MDASLVGFRPNCFRSHLCGLFFLVCHAINAVQCCCVLLLLLLLPVFHQQVAGFALSVKWCRCVKSYTDNVAYFNSKNVQNVAFTRECIENRRLPILTFECKMSPFSFLYEVLVLDFVGLNAWDYLIGTHGKPMRGRVYVSWPIVNIQYLVGLLYYNFSLRLEARAIGACTLLFHAELWKSCLQSVKTSGILWSLLLPVSGSLLSSVP